MSSYITEYFSRGFTLPSFMTFIFSDVESTEIDKLVRFIEQKRILFPVRLLLSLQYMINHNRF